MILMAHVARLAKPYQIVSGISQISGREKPEWLNVVDRKALADVHPAIGAIPLLLANYSSASKLPASAAIGFRSAHPVWSRRSLRLGRTPAFDRAELSHAILLGKPRLLPETCPAMAAGEVKAIAPVGVGTSPHVFRSECVGRAQSRAELISNQVGLGSGVQKLLSLPAGSARRTTKTRFFRPIGLHMKVGLAGFAGHLDHANTVSQRRHMGNRTTLIACRRVEEATRQPDLFITAPEQPKQEALL